MSAQIENGSHWGIHRPTKDLPGISGGIICENPTLHVTLFVEKNDDQLKIPIPPTLAPTDAIGEGVYISTLRSEEGQEPQLFLNVPPHASITLFDRTQEDVLRIVNIGKGQKLPTQRPRLYIVPNH